jgi:hypothetical protein
MATRLANGTFPLDTPVGEMGLNANEASMLTDAAKKLTKKDLLILQDTVDNYRTAGEGKIVQVFDARTGLNLNIGDMASIAHAFGDMQARRNSGAQGAAADACCCCTCTPCCSCCATVVIEARL